jgi:aquaporin Z
MNKYVAEFIGTFFLVLTIGCTVIGHSAGPFAPLAIGSALMVMIFAGGHISGGHFNPAVTLGVWLRGKCETKDVAPYMTFQIMGGVLAALAVRFLKGGGAVAPLHPATVPALLAEFLFTFALVYVVLNVAKPQGHDGQFFLRAGDRIHGAGGRVFRRQHFRWGLQPSGRGGHLRYGAVVLAEYLDLPAS